MGAIGSGEASIGALASGERGRLTRAQIYANRSICPRQAVATICVDLHWRRLTQFVNQNIFEYVCAEPRTFKLLDELEQGEHGSGDPSCSYGLDNPNDQTFTNWNGTIVGPANTRFDGRIYFLSITCGDQYPA